MSSDHAKSMSAEMPSLHQHQFQIVACLQISSDCKICRGVGRPLQTKILSPGVFRWPDLRCDCPKLPLWCLSPPASAYVIPLPPLLYCSPLSTQALDPCLWHGAHCAWLFLWQVTAFWGQAPWTPWYTYLIPVSVHMFHPNPQVYFLF